MNKIIKHILSVLPAVLLQALWLYVLFRWLAPWAPLIDLVLSILSVLFVLYLITKREESTYKILWLLVILTFPLAGALLYLERFRPHRTIRPRSTRLLPQTTGVCRRPSAGCRRKPALPCMRTGRRITSRWATRCSP